VTTPFAEAGGVLASAFESNLRGWGSHPISGFVIAGSTGEAPLLDDDELFDLVGIARGIATDGTVIAGTGAEATHRVIASCREAAARGADAVLVRAPMYYRGAMTPAVLSRHFMEVADASPVPVILYHIPKFVPVELDPELVEALVRHENIIGIKDSSGGLENLRALVAACGSNGSVLVGSGALLQSALESGARGGVLGVALLATAQACELHAAWRDGDLPRATELQSRIGPLHQAVVAGCGIPGIKAALDRLGYFGGPLRPPLRPLGEDRVTIVDAALEAAGLGVSASP